MDVVSLVPLSVPLPVYPPHRLVWRDEKALSPTENKCNIVVLIEMSWAPARLNEPGCERRSSKYSVDQPLLPLAQSVAADPTPAPKPHSRSVHFQAKQPLGFPRRCLQGRVPDGAARPTYWRVFASLSHLPFGME